MDDGEDTRRCCCWSLLPTLSGPLWSLVNEPPPLEPGRSLAREDLLLGGFFKTTLAHEVTILKKTVVSNVMKKAKYLSLIICIENVLECVSLELTDKTEQQELPGKLPNTAKNFGP